MHAMQSSWSISYFGGHSEIMLKKLERLGQFIAQDVETERLLIFEKKVEHASFLVSHDTESWPALAMDILSIARRLMPEWTYLSGKSR